MIQDYNVKQFNYSRKICDFLRWDLLAFSLSLLLLITSIIIISIRGFNWGLDFTGGTVIEINLGKPANLDLMRDRLKQAKFQDPIVQYFGSSHDIIVRLPLIDGIPSREFSKKVINVISSIVGGPIIVKRLELVGPNIGSELEQNAATALLTALICILIYVGLRFEWRLAAGTVIALGHDVLITLGSLSLFQIELDLTIVASLMSVISYSLNDSIVVSDRIRENLRNMDCGNPYKIINISLTQTLGRTLMTSAATLLVVLTLYVFGGAMLNGFSLVMLIGVSFGTLSSIYIVSALALKFGIKREHMLQQKIEKEGGDRFTVLP